MQIFSTDTFMYDEIIKRKWQNNLDDSIDCIDDFEWEILNENSQHHVFKRHWFKQNYINHLNDSISMLIHH